MYTLEDYKNNDNKLPEILQAVPAVSAYRALFFSPRGLYFTTTDHELCVLGNFRNYLCDDRKRSVRSRHLFGNEKRLLTVTRIDDEADMCPCEQRYQQTSLGCVVQEQEVCGSPGPAGFTSRSKCCIPLTELGCPVLKSV